MDRELWFLVPGDLDARTGGYEYDRRIIAGLRARGWSVHVVSLPGSYPWLTADAKVLRRLNGDRRVQALAG